MHKVNQPGTSTRLNLTYLTILINTWKRAREETIQWSHFLFFLITFYIIFNNYLGIDQIVIDKNDIIIIIYLYNNINILYNLYF
jgi:hypothetical protein